MKNKLGGFQEAGWGKKIRGDDSGRVDPDLLFLIEMAETLESSGQAVTWKS